MHSYRTNRYHSNPRCRQTVLASLNVHLSLGTQTWPHFWSFWWRNSKYPSQGPFEFAPRSLRRWPLSGARGISLVVKGADLIECLTAAGVSESGSTKKKCYSQNIIEINKNY